MIICLGCRDSFLPADRGPRAVYCSQKCQQQTNGWTRSAALEQLRRRHQAEFKQLLDDIRSRS